MAEHYSPYPKLPILKLHNDLLWYIFWINADMEYDPEDDEIPPLDTLRHSSQVCSRWRHLILSSSSLWGQVIQITSLRQQNCKTEVMRRTGQSLLCVLGGNRLSGGLAGYEQLAVDLVSRYWDRIRWLELDFTHARWGDNRREEQFWDIFQQPSDVLETFRVTLLTYERANKIYSPILSDPDFVIFDNCAPALRVFYSPNIKFNLDAPWLAHLRYLALNAPVSAYDLLRAIPHMPLLECLADEDSNAITHTRSRGGDPLPQITNNSITQITIISFLDMRPYLDFLAHIKPYKCCLIFIYVGTIPDAETLISSNRILNQYSNCCELASAIAISLTMYRYRFEFEAQIPSLGPFRFDLDFTDQSEDLPPGTVEAFFTTLPLQTCQCQKVVTLRLGIDPSIIEPSNPKIVKFILLFSAVEMLSTIPETLNFLLGLPSDTFTLSFSVLQRVGLSSCWEKAHGSIIKAFIAARISIGKPILTLAICVDPDDGGDFGYLEEFTGLKVIFEFEGDETLEYVCGGAHPEKLHIKPRRQSSFAQTGV